MSKHTLRMTQGERAVGNEGIKLSVYVNDDKFGTLMVRRGSISWRPFNGVEIRMSWERFAELIQGVE